MWEQPGKCISPTVIFTCEELEEEGQRKLWPQSGGETTSVLSNGTTTGRWHFAGPEPVQEIQHWDKAAKTYIDVRKASIVGIYNKYMGGVDLLDSFTAKHKYALKSWWWYMYIFWHTITLAVVNAWLLYKQHSLCSQDAKGDTEYEKVPSTAGFLSHYGNDLFVLFTLFVINQTGIWDVHKLIHLYSNLADTTLKTPKRGRPSSINKSPETGALWIVERDHTWMMEVQRLPLLKSHANHRPWMRAWTKLDVSPWRQREDTADIAVKGTPIPNAVSVMSASVFQRTGTVSGITTISKGGLHTEHINFSGERENTADIALLTM